MAMIYTVREIVRDGKPTGKYRMTSASDESEDGIILGLCEHEHSSPDEARTCPVVTAKLARIFPIMPECDKLQDRIAELELALRKIHDRAHEWNAIPLCVELEQIAFDALGLKGGA